MFLFLINLALKYILIFSDLIFDNLTCLIDIRVPGFSLCLKRIIFDHSKNVTDQSLEAFSRHSNCLEEICFNHCPNVSDVGFKALLEGCLELKVVRFYGTKITDKAIETAKEKYKHVHFNSHYL